jgi:hypothetical protein
MRSLRARSVRRVSGEHGRVEAVVLVSRRPVAAAQVLDLARADHHHGDPGLDQRDRAPVPVRVRTASSSRSPAALCSIVNRWTSRPRASTTDTA